VSENQFVTADAQFGMAKILRPFDGYDNVYQGLSAGGFAINLSEGGVPLDSNAGKPGYDPNLVRGVPVPLGSRIVLWLPCFGVSAKAMYRYNYHIIWRMRTLFDFRTSRVNYHLPRQAAGPRDTTPVTGGDRVVIPACVNPALYNSVNPGTPLGVSDLEAYPELIIPSNNPATGTFLTPQGVNGVVQQGIADPATVPSANDPWWLYYETQAAGDEMILGVTRNLPLPANWNFLPGGNDNSMHEFFASSDVAGVFAFAGSAP